MFEELMLDVHRQWLAEFDREQAIRRQIPARRRRSATGSTRLARLMRLRQQERPPSLASRLPQAPQCT